jgi:hypothetical protein
VIFEQLHHSDSLLVRQDFRRRTCLTMGHSRPDAVALVVLSPSELTACKRNTTTLSSTQSALPPDSAETLPPSP